MAKKDPRKVSKRILEETLTLAILDVRFLSKLVKIVPVDYFKSLGGRTSVCFEIAKICYDYFEETREAPVNYFDTLFDELCDSKDDEVAKHFRAYYDKLHELQKEKDYFNEIYLLSEMKKRGNLIKIDRAAQRLGLAADSGNAKDASEITEQLRNELTEGETVVPEKVFETEMDFSSDYNLVDRVLHFDIPPIDNFIPRGIHRGDLVTIVAGTKVGKTWMMTHLGDVASYEGRNVLHISCELSTKETHKRYHQMAGFLVNDKYPKEISIRRFDAEGNDLHENLIREFDTVQDPEAVKKVRSTMLRMEGSVRAIKLNSPKVQDIQVIIEELKITENWKPDVLIVDYVEMMHINMKDMRQSIFETYKDLRNLGDKYDAAVITASQPNRGGMDRKIRTGTVIAEDIRKAQVSDLVVALSKTGRTEDDVEDDVRDIFILYNRTGKANFGCEFQCNFEIGQMVMDSYWPCRSDNNRNENVSLD